jgi:hypothetical protein
VGYIIQTDEVSLAEQANYRREAIKQGFERALKLAIAEPGAPDPNLEYNGRYSNLKARAFDYVNDFVIPTAGAAAAIGLAGWLTVPLAAVGTPYSIFATTAGLAFVPQVPNTQVWVFYKYCIPYAVNWPVTYLVFAAGNAGQYRKDEFDLEPAYAKLSTDAFLNNPVIYDKAEFCTITVRARVITPAFAFVLQGWVIEPVQ